MSSKAEHHGGPSLRMFANLWTLWDHPRAGAEWSLEEKIVAIKEAGFGGFAWLLDVEHGRLARKHGLWTIGFISSGTPAEFGSLIRKSLDAGALRLNVQLADHDTPVADAVRMAMRIIEEAEALKLPCDIEIHRDTCTETPEKAYAIADGYRAATGRLLPISWDFSHLAVVKHLSPPFAERLIVDPELIQHSRQFHFRPFNGHHAQIPVTDGTGAPSGEFRQWLPFLEKVLETWLSAGQDGQELFACPEMGPVRGGYNLGQLPDSWAEAKVLRTVIEQTWAKVHPTVAVEIRKEIGDPTV